MEPLSRSLGPLHALRIPLSPAFARAGKSSYVNQVIQYCGSAYMTENKDEIKQQTKEYLTVGAHRFHSEDRKSITDPFAGGIGRGMFRHRGSGFQPEQIPRPTGKGSLAAGRHDLKWPSRELRPGVLWGLQPADAAALM
jgi:hypothetical protein